MSSLANFSMFKMHIPDIRVSRHRHADISAVTLMFASMRISRCSTSDVFPIRKLEHFRGTVKPHLQKLANPAQNPCDKESDKDAESAPVSVSRTASLGVQF